MIFGQLYANKCELVCPQTQKLLNTTGGLIKQRKSIFLLNRRILVCWLNGAMGTITAWALMACKKLWDNMPTLWQPPFFVKIRASRPRRIEPDLKPFPYTPMGWWLLLLEPFSVNPKLWRKWEIPLQIMSLFSTRLEASFVSVFTHLSILCSLLGVIPLPLSIKLRHNCSLTVTTSIQMFLAVTPGSDALSTTHTCKEIHQIWVQLHYLVYMHNMTASYNFPFTLN